jgi:hypothetical protein
METFDLLQKYLRENTSYTDVTLTDYEMNGSVIKLKYFYNPNYDWDKKYISYDNKMEVEVLDYITWVYNLCKS